MPSVDEQYSIIFIFGNRLEIFSIQTELSWPLMSNDFPTILSGGRLQEAESNRICQISGQSGCGRLKNWRSGTL